MNGLPMTEAQFTSAVIELAKYRGWMVTHFRPARTKQGWRTAIEGHKGFPDLVLARDGQVIFAELKIGKAKLRPDQQKWAEALPVVFVWTPADLRGPIADVLR